jgi:hypothetical protein
VIQRHPQVFLSLVTSAITIVLVTGCAPVEPRPAGVGRGISFSVTPLYPRSFDITAAGSRLRDTNELKEAWHKKALLVANGHHFKSSPLVMHNNESDYGGGPMLSRSVTGTITLTD